MPPSATDGPSQRQLPLCQVWCWSYHCNAKYDTLFAISPTSHRSTSGHQLVQLTLVSYPAPGSMTAVGPGGTENASAR